MCAPYELDTGDVPSWRNPMTTLTSPQIMTLVAGLTGQPAKRAENKTAAETRFRKVAAEVGLPDADAILARPFDQAEAAVRAFVADKAAAENLDAALDPETSAGGDAAIPSMTDGCGMLPSDVPAPGTSEEDADFVPPKFLRRDAAVMETVSRLAEEAAAAAGVKPAKGRKAAAEKAPKAEKPAKAPKAPKAATAPAGDKGPTKREIMLSMASRKEGATEAEICEAIGWKACLVTLRRVCEAEGYDLRTERQKGARARYYATKKAG
jgi:hypothetical protein